MLARDWRAGELRVLAAALVIAVASITGVSFFADRVSRGLARDATQLLGADLLLMSDHPWRAGIGDENARRGPARAPGGGFISMGVGGGPRPLARGEGGTGKQPPRRQAPLPPPGG